VSREKKFQEARKRVAIGYSTIYIPSCFQFTKTILQLVFLTVDAGPDTNNLICINAISLFAALWSGRVASSCHVDQSDSWLFRFHSGS
jgi:hypothetical protein